MCVMEEAHEEHCTQAIMTHELSTCSVILFFCNNLQEYSKEEYQYQKICFIIFNIKYEFMKMIKIRLSFFVKAWVILAYLFGIWPWGPVQGMCNGLLWLNICTNCMWGFS